MWVGKLKDYRVESVVSELSKSVSRVEEITSLVIGLRIGEWDLRAGRKQPAGLRLRDDLSFRIKCSACMRAFFIRGTKAK